MKKNNQIQYFVLIFLLFINNNKFVDLEYIMKNKQKLT